MFKQTINRVSTNMLKQTIRRSSTNKNISLDRYVNDHTNMTNKQLDMIRNHMDKQLDMIRNNMNEQLIMIRNHMDSQHETTKWQFILSIQMILAGFAGVGYMFHNMDKRLEHCEQSTAEVKQSITEVQQSIAEIKQMIAQSNASK